MLTWPRLGAAHLACARLGFAHDAELLVHEREHPPLRLLELLLERRALEEVDTQIGRHRLERITLQREGGLLREGVEVSRRPHDASPRNVRPRHVLGTKLQRLRADAESEQDDAIQHGARVDSRSPEYTLESRELAGGGKHRLYHK